MLNTALRPATSPEWSVTHIDEVIAEHNEIIATLASGDMRRAAEAARAHILSFKRALLSAYRAFQRWKRLRCVHAFYLRASSSCCAFSGVTTVQGM